MNITEITAIKQQSDKLIRLAAYCRVSSISDDQRHSFAAQIRYYSEYTRKHPEYLLVDIYADEGLSGTDMKKRDELNRLIRDCKKGKIDRIICKSVSRFARNTEELLVTLRMLKKLGVSVYFEEQGIDTDKLNMEMIVTFPGMAAQQESIAISGNMRWSYQKRMQSGEFNTCRATYGFDLKDGQLVPRDDEMIVVKRIFGLYLQGMGTQTIASLLNDEGVLRRNNQKKWRSSTIQYILKNERYMGDALLQKTFASDTLPFRTVKNIGQKPKYYVENINPAIVSREDYDAAQELLQRRGHIGRKSEQHLLTGKLRCPECGRAFRHKTNNGKAYWICAGRSSGATSCMHRRLREDMVCEASARMINKLKDNRKCLLGTLIHQVETMQSVNSDVQGKVRQIDKELADLSARNLVVTKLYTKGILTAAEYTGQTTELENRITELRIERKKWFAEDEDSEWLEQLKALNELIKEDNSTAEGLDEALFLQIVESITVNDNTKVTFRLIGGIELVESINEKGRCKRA